MAQVFSTMKDKPSAYPFLLPSETGIGAKKYYDYQPIEFSISTDEGKTWHSCFDDPDLEGVYCFSAPDVQPAVQTDSLKKVGLQDGQRLMSTSYDTRQLTMQIVSMDNIDEGSSLLGYDAMQQFLVSRDPYWICFASWPQRMYYVKAKLSAPTYTGNSWTATVTFTDLIGLSRSVGTTQDTVYGFGNNLKQKPQYTFSTNKFTVYNGSNVLIDPERRGHPFKMTLNGSSNGNLKITNKTTGDFVHGTSDLKFNGSFVIDGVSPELNGEGCLLDLTKDDNVITLQIGDNDFEVENFTGTVSFDFAEWWLS